MATIINKAQISSLVRTLDVISAMEKGFIQYSNGQTVVPPVGEMLLEKEKGEVHIKYGYIQDDDFFVIKIAGGFYNNPKHGISSSQGMMLVFNQKTGQTEAVLLDEGLLTDIRTAAAGALVAKYFAPKKIKGIGIIGTGIQAHLQLEYLKKVTNCKKVWVWGRNLEKAIAYKQKFKNDFDINIAESTTQVTHNSNLIVTTTPSNTPLISADNILPGTHITAVGSDNAHKQELDSKILAKADILIADSISQCMHRGEIYQALKQNIITQNNITELGIAIQNNSLQRSTDQQITVADLTGVAVQDIMIATAAYLNFKNP